MKTRTFLALVLAAGLCGGFAYQAAAQGGGGGGGGGRGGRGGVLTQDQNTQLRDAVTAAQADFAPLQEKLSAAQKDAIAAVLAKADDATIRAKVEAVEKIETDIAVLRYSKAVKAVAATLTDDQKSTLTGSAMPAAAYAQFFGGGFAGGGGRGRRGGGGGGGGGGN